MNSNPIQDCLDFFRKAVPEPDNRNFSTQLGCHLEEVREMLQELAPCNEHAAKFLSDTMASIHTLANYLKAGPDRVTIQDRAKFLDGLCDQKVTAIGVAYMAGMDIDGGFREVNRSNLSKFDEAGQPIFDENRKVSKGPNYSPAELSPFV